MRKLLRKITAVITATALSVPTFFISGVQSVKADDVVNLDYATYEYLGPDIGAGIDASGGYSKLEGKGDVTFEDDGSGKLITALDAYESTINSGSADSYGYSHIETEPLTPNMSGNVYTLVDYINPHNTAEERSEIVPAKYQGVLKGMTSQHNIPYSITEYYNNQNKAIGSEFSFGNASKGGFNISGHNNYIIRVGADNDKMADLGLSIPFDYSDFAHTVSGDYCEDLSTTSEDSLYIKAVPGRIINIDTAGMEANYQNKGGHKYEHLDHWQVESLKGTKFDLTDTTITIVIDDNGKPYIPNPANSQTGCYLDQLKQLNPIFVGFEYTLKFDYKNSNGKTVDAGTITVHNGDKYDLSGITNMSNPENIPDGMSFNGWKIDQSTAFEQNPKNYDVVNGRLCFLTLPDKTTVSVHADLQVVYYKVTIKNAATGTTDTTSFSKVKCGDSISIKKAAEAVGITDDSFVWDSDNDGYGAQGYDSAKGMIPVLSDMTLTITDANIVYLATPASYYADDGKTPQSDANKNRCLKLTVKSSDTGKNLPTPNTNGKWDYTNCSVTQSGVYSGGAVTIKGQPGTFKQWDYDINGKPVGLNQLKNGDVLAARWVFDSVSYSVDTKYSPNIGALLTKKNNITSLVIANVHSNNAFDTLGKEQIKTTNVGGGTTLYNAAVKSESKGTFTFNDGVIGQLNTTVQYNINYSISMTDKSAAWNQYMTLLIGSETIRIATPKTLYNSTVTVTAKNLYAYRAEYIHSDGATVTVSPITCKISN